ncbi:MAG TPA: hypothetical protein VFM18_05265 [Methanosarcina sp.]|nr:hypothetical protein [Methanosarcina sp.]
MLEKIKQIGLEKFAGDEQLADAFVEGFAKEAFDLGELGKSFAGAIGKGIGGTVVGLGINSFSKAMNNIEGTGLHNQFMMALEHAMKTNPVLRQKDTEKVVNYAETIFKFAPHVATDANVLSSVLAHCVHGEGVDSNIIKTLTDLESRYIDNHSATVFSPKTYV